MSPCTAEKIITLVIYGWWNCIFSFQDLGTVSKYAQNDGDLLVPMPTSLTSSTLLLYHGL